MKKGLIIVVVLLLALAGYFFYNKSKGGSMLGTDKVTSGAMSIKELIAAGVPQKCTFSSTEEGSVSQGTTYVSGGKVRGDFTTEVEGKATVSHMISDGTTSYIWTDGEKEGFKMTVTEEDTADVDESATKPDTSVTGSGDLNEKVDYNCSAWIPDGSVFNPPSDVKFSDLSALMQPSGMPASGQNTASQCAYCDSLSGEDKTSCLSALSCE